VLYKCFRKFYPAKSAANRGGGQGADWVMVGLDPACPEPESELQMRAAVLLVLTWDIKMQSGIRHACSSFNTVMLLHLHCGSCDKACH